MAYHAGVVDLIDEEYSENDDDDEDDKVDRVVEHGPGTQVAVPSWTGLILLLRWIHGEEFLEILEGMTCEKDKTKKPVLGSIGPCDPA